MVSSKGHTKIPNPSFVSPSEYYLTPANYREIFRKSYVRSFTAPAIINQSGEPVIQMMTHLIDPDRWEQIYGSPIPIPVITPSVRVSVSSNDIDSDRLYTFTIPIASDVDIHPYRSFSILNPDIIYGQDGCRYFEYRHVTSVKIRDRHSFTGWKEVQNSEPSGIVLRWKEADEEHCVTKSKERAVGP